MLDKSINGFYPLPNIFTITFFLVFSVGYLPFAEAQAPCDVHQVDLMAGVNSNTGFSGSNIRRGQIFVPCQSGEIVSISVGMRGNNLNSAGTYSLFIGENDNGGVPLQGAAIADQIVSEYDDNIIITWDLSANPFPVSAGTVYRFEQGISGGIQAFLVDNDYPDGDRIASNVGAQTVSIGGVFSDIEFSVTINPFPPVPTMSQWAFFLSALLVFVVGLVGVYNVRKARV